MEALDYIEAQAARTLDVLIGEYATLHERIYKLLTLLLGGAGALGNYALARLSTQASSVTWLPVAILSLWWFCIAAWLMLRAMQSRELGIGATPNVLGTSYTQKGGDFGIRHLDENRDALANTRLAELATQQVRIMAFSGACEARTRTMDFAYLAAAASPVPPLVALLLVHWI